MSRRYSNEGARYTFDIQRHFAYGASMHDHYAIGQRQQLFDVAGINDDGSALCPGIEQAGVNRLRRSYVETASGVLRDDERWKPIKLPSDNELLLVAP